jgi:DNA-binding Lrp family transcriptional regulator
VEQKQILSALDLLGEASYEKLHEETGLPRTPVQRRLEELGDRVVKRGAGKRGDPFLFSAHSLTGQKETCGLTDAAHAARASRSPSGRPARMSRAASRTPRTLPAKARLRLR